MTSQKHDLLVSRTSHLPHLLAAQLVNFVLNEGAPAEQATLCANGFKDTTRIASGSPEMWRDIALSNRKHLSRAVSGYITMLEELKRALVRGDDRRLAAFFAMAKTNRDEWLRRHGGEQAHS